MIADTTYLLPLARIGVDTDLLKAIAEGKTGLRLEDLTISLISTFELQAKAAKMNIPAEYASEAVKTIHSAFRVEPFNRSEIIDISFELRRTIRDYIDCIIVATGVALKEDIATEDSLILANKQQIKKQYRVDVLTYKDLVRT